jgi:hypothetical protein
MRSKILVVLIAVALMGVSSAVMARGGGGGGKGGSGGHVGHTHSGNAHFGNHFLRNRFLRNQAVLGGWGWGWGYGDNGYGNTTVVAFPQATPQAAGVTGSIATGPCHWNADTFNVPSSGGGTRPVEVVSCR